MPTYQFPRGAIPTPKHKLCGATPHVVLTTPPTQFAVVPKQLSYWLNNQYGDCVTAEEAFAVAAYTTMLGLPEVVIPDDVVMSWCRSNGVLNGADLLSVIQQMQQSGFVVNGESYNDGAPTSVDYSNENILQSAISLSGAVKIGIDASALPSGAGNSNGWYSTDSGNYRNEDHAVSLCGYGNADWLFQQLGITLPSGLTSSTPGYLLFTWSTIGFVTHGWIMGTCGEAWLRTPTKIGSPNPLNPVNPPVPTPPNPNPVPTPTNNTLSVQTAIPAGKTLLIADASNNAIGTVITNQGIPVGNYSVNG